jgi:hypothetical protein
MKEYNHIKTTKNTDGSYVLDIVATRWELLKAIFRGELRTELSANAASSLSAKLYTPKKKYYKKSEKAILKGE